MQSPMTPALAATEFSTPRTSGRILTLPVVFVVVSWLLLGGLPAFLGSDGRLFMAAAVGAGGFYVFLLALASSRHVVTTTVSDAWSATLFLGFYAWYAVVMMLGSPATSPPGTMSVAVTVLCFAAFFGQIFLMRAPPQRLFRYAIWAVPLYMAANALLLDGGILHLTELATSGRRLVRMPSLLGANSIAAVAGLGVISAYFLSRKKRGWRLVPLTLSALSMLVLIACGSRGPLLYTILILMLSVVLPVRWLGRMTATLALLTAVSTPILMFVFISIENMGLADLFLRTGGEQLGVGTGRPLLWQAAIATLGSLDPAHLFGYGYGSALVSGAMPAFYLIFNEEAFMRGEPFIPTLHNLGLQLIYDTGYIGLALFVLLILRAVKMLRRSDNDSIVRYCLATISYILLSGFTEPVGSIYNLDVFFVMLVTIAMSLGLKPVRQAKDQGQPGEVTRPAHYAAPRFR